MLAESKRRVWLELQAAISANPVCESCHQTEGEFWYTPDGRAWCERHAGGHDPAAVQLSLYCQIWRQEPIGTVTVNGPHIDLEKALTFSPDNPWEFAWCDPVSGIRIVAENFPGAELVEQMKHLQNVMNDSKTDVIVYATWPECIVKRSDPEPPSPQDEAFRRFDETYAHLKYKCEEKGPWDWSRRAGDSPDIEAQYTELESVIVLDDATKLAKVTAWALLDIAGVLRESSFDLRAITGALTDPPKSARHLGLWERFKLWVERFKLWVWGDPIEGPPEGSNPVSVAGGSRESGTCERCEGPTVGDLVLCPDCAKELLDRRIPTNYEQAVEMGWPILPEGFRSGGTPTDRQPGTMHDPVPVGVDPSKPHVFSYLGGCVTLPLGHSFCSHCGLPQDDPIHGYIGD